MSAFTHLCVVLSVIEAAAITRIPSLLQQQLSSVIHVNVNDKVPRLLIAAADSGVKFEGESAYDHDFHAHPLEKRALMAPAPPPRNSAKFDGTSTYHVSPVCCPLLNQVLLSLCVSRCTRDVQSKSSLFEHGMTGTVLSTALRLLPGEDTVRSSSILNSQ